MDLPQAQLHQIDSIHATVLRIILQLPKHTSYDAMFYITGDVTLTTLLSIRGVANLQRIRHLPTDTQIGKPFDQNTRDTFGYYKARQKIVECFQNTFNDV